MADHPDLHKHAIRVFGLNQQAYLPARPPSLGPIETAIRGFIETAIREFIETAIGGFIETAIGGRILSLNAEVTQETEPPRFRLEPRIISVQQRLVPCLVSIEA